MVNSQAGTKYQIVDEATGLPAKGQVLKKKGKDLMVSVDGEDVAVIQDFYADVPVGEAPTYQVSEASGAAGEGAGASGESLAQAEFITGGSQGTSSGLSDGIVWGPGLDSGAFQVAAAEEAGLSTTQMVGLGLGGLAAGGGATAVAVAAGGGAAAAAAGGDVAITTILGTVVAGPIVAGTDLKVAIYDSNGRLLQVGEVGDDGSFRVEIGTYTGAIIAKVYDDGDTINDYLDEHSRQPTDLASALFAVGYVESAGTEVHINITPLTTLAAKQLGVDVSANANSAPESDAGIFVTGSQVDVANANSDTAKALGLNVDALLSAPVIAVVKEALDPDGNVIVVDDPNRNDYGLILAALAGNVAGQNVFETILADTETYLNTDGSLTAAGVDLLARGAASSDDEQASQGLEQSFLDLFTKDVDGFSIDPVTEDNYVSVNELNNGILITGTANPDDTVSFAIGGVPLVDDNGDPVTVTADENGHWEFVWYGDGLPDGGYVISATVGDVTAERVVILDTTAPTQSTNVGISADSGNPDDEAIATNQANQDLSGTLNAPLDTGEKVMVKLNDGEWVEATVDGTTWTLPGQTLLPGDNIVQVAVVDAAGNYGSITEQIITLDGSSSQITGMVLGYEGELSVDGGITYLNGGDQITVTVSMDEAVVVDTTGGTPRGTPRIKLNITGVADGTETYAVYDATLSALTGDPSQLVFVYTIPEVLTDLGSISIDANTLGATGGLELNDGSIKDAAGNLATLTHDAVTADTAYQVDTSAPTQTIGAIEISADMGRSDSDFITNQDTQTISGTLSAPLAAGEKVLVGVNGTGWVEAVVVDNAGVLTWSVGVGLALTEGEHTIRAKVVDGIGNEGPETSRAYTLDTSDPTQTIGAIEISADMGRSDSDFITNQGAQTISGTLNAPLAAGEKVLVSVNGTDWVEAVVVDNAGVLTWSLANQTLVAGAGQSIQVKIEDAAGNESAVASQAYTLDTTEPTIASVAITGHTHGVVDGGVTYLNVDDTVSFTVTLDEAVYVVAGSGGEVPRLMLNIGETEVYATYASGTGTTALVFTYTIEASQTDINGIGIPANALELNGATIRDIAGNNANLPTTVVSDNAAYQVDTTAPVGSMVADQTLNNGASVQIQSSEVGTAYLVRSDVVVETLDSITGAAADQWKSVAISAADTDTALSLAGLAEGAYKLYTVDRAGNLSGPETHTVTVDNTPPIVSDIAITGHTHGVVDGGVTYLNAGDTVSITVTMNEAAYVVAGSGGELPRLMLNLGGAPVYATYASGTGTTALVFTYTIEAGQTDINGIGIPADALELNGATIRDLAGNNANLTTTVESGNAAYQVDTTAPVGSMGADQTLNNSASVQIQSSEVGTAYLVHSGVTVTNQLTSITGAAADQWKSVAINAADTPTALSLAGLTDGTYKLYTVDKAGNLSAAAENTVLLDSTAPTLVRSSPADDDGVTPSYLGSADNLVLEFSEPIIKGTGSIRIVNDTDGTTIAIAVTDASVTVDGNKVIIDPAADLALGKNYHIEIDATAFVDKAGNAYVGISDATTLNFEVPDPSISLDAISTDNRINSAESMAPVTLSGKVSASNPAVLTAITSSNISVTFTSTTDGSTIAGTVSSYDSGTGVWQGSVAGAFQDGHSYTVAVAVAPTGFDGASTSATVDVDLTPPDAPTVSFTDTGTAGDRLTKNGKVTVSGLETGAVWKYSTDGGNSWTTGTGSSFTLGEGVYSDDQVQVRQIDVAGNQGLPAKMAALEIDTTASTVTVDSVLISDDTGTSSSDLLTKTASQDLSGTLSAALELGDRVMVSLNGGNWEEATVTGTSWSLAGKLLSEGDNTIRVAVVDEADLFGAIKSQAVTVDLTVPTQTTTVAISADTGTAGDFLTKTAAQDLSGSLSAALDTGDRVMVKLNGGNWQVATVTGTAWSLAGQTLVDGDNSIQVKVVDAAGNDGSVTSQTVTLDRTAPTQTTTVAISHDTGTSSSDLLTRTPLQTITGTLSAALDTGDRVLVSLNGSGWEAATVDGTTWSLAGQTLVEGDNAVAVVIVDAADNYLPATEAVVMLDTIAPTVTVDSILISDDTGTAGDFITGTASQTLSGTLGAALATDERVLVSVNGIDWVEADVTDTTWSLTGQTLNIEGDNTIEVKVVDGAGNDGPVTSQVVTLDTTAPTQTSTVAISVDTGNPDDDLIATQIAEQTLSGTLSAALDAGDRVMVSYNNGSWEEASVSGTTWTLSSNKTLLAGDNTVEVKVVDAAGNVGPIGSQIITLDTTNPTQTTTVAITADTGTAGDFLTKTAAQDLSGTLSAALDTGDRVLVRLNGSGWEVATITGTDWSLTGKTLVDGDNTIEVKVVDAAGNEGTVTSQTVTLDTTAPTQTTTVAISDDTDTAGDFITATASQTISGTLSAALATDERVLVSVNGIDWVAADVSGTTWSLANQTLVGGENKFIEVKVVDDAGNEDNVLSQSYTLTDTTPPEVQSIAITGADGLQNSRLNAGDVVRITVTMSEAVTVTGTPNLGLKIGSTTVQAAYASGSGTDALVFEYTIQAGQTDIDGISIDADSLSLNGGTIMNAANNNADLSHFGASDNAGYLVDTTAPTGTLTTASLLDTASATVKSSEVGTAYLVSSDITIADKASLDSFVADTNNDAKWNSVNITAANTNTNLSLAGLLIGNYKLYTVDQAGNLSSASSNTVTVLPSTLDLSTVSGVRLNLIAGNTVNGKIYYYLDANGNGATDSGDTINHNLLDGLLNGGSDTVDTQTSGAVKGVDDARTVIVNGFTLVLPTLTELHALYTAVDAANGATASGVPSGWNSDYYWSATQSSSGYHWDGFTCSMAPSTTLTTRTAPMWRSR
ncbi:hypothetical protein ICHIJ1_19900 [Fluviibacter phosphoraccumulans]|uniref:Ig-like domain-containing protein n=1 Tax=Fluviibacter phosphoraccumulans TaxID=1751046 RepID=A0A7R6R1S0_9RHOO|nr:hypothetical protein ICHIAU1_10590 [Fluviibacter phosphoraccumulans]BBU72071.1 hypothetical protein ICHIJ1_19900 [Fluviibacter phosphoraccumulans]